MPAPGRNRLLWGNRRYSDKVLSIQRANLLAYWKLAETSGTTIVDSSGNGRTGTYTGVDLGQTGIGDGGTAPLWDGVNDYGNVYSAGLAGAFNGSEGTLLLWFRVSAAGVWTDATTRRLITLEINSSNRVTVGRSTTNNQLAFDYRAGGTIESVNASLSPTGWTCVALTWSKTTEEMKAYLNGVQSGSTQTALGVWVGTLPSAYLGSSSAVPQTPWSGYLAHTALWSTALSAAEIARLATL